MSRTSPAPAADHRMEAARVGAAIACFTVAVAWPLLNLGSRNTVLHLWGSHGIDDGDIVSVIPLVVGLAMLAFPWRRRLPLGVAVAALAIGILLGGALGVVYKLAR